MLIKKFRKDPKKFKLVESINNGAYGRVYSVQNLDTNELLAAKVILNSSSQAQIMINREIGIMARMKHPTIIKFYGYSLVDFEGLNNVTIFMQLARKGSLAEQLQKVRNGNPDPRFNNTVRQKILVGIARGMMYLHQHQVIHRDLKPFNILLNDDFEPLITDFGVSKFALAYQTDLINSQSAGTPTYMAPEVIQGTTYNGKADVYSFGILMFEVVTNQIPFPEAHNKKMAIFNLTKNIISGKRPEFKTKVKRPIRKLIESCWSPDPLVRPTFEEIFNRLAYNIEESIYDIFEDNKDKLEDLTISDEYEMIDEKVTENEDENGEKYYLDGVDSNEVISYADKIAKDDNTLQIEIEQMKQQITKLEQKTITNDDSKPADSSDEIQLLKAQITEMRTKQENDINALTDKINQMMLQMGNLISENDKLKQQVKDLQSELEGKENQIINIVERDVKIQEIPSGNNQLQSSKPGIELPYSLGKEFKGIINYIQTHSENIDDEINITSSSVPRNAKRYSPQNAIIYQDSKVEFSSKEEDNPWICFDFKERRVIPTGYIIRSTPVGPNGSHPKSWVIEGSNEDEDEDEDTWDIIDNQKNCTLLNGKNYVNEFSIENPTNKKYQYLRMRLTDTNWYNRKALCINNIEFYGNLI